MDSGSKFGVGLLTAGMICVIALMVKVRGHWGFEAICAVFLLGQMVNLVMIVRGARR